MCNNPTLRTDVLSWYLLVSSLLREGEEHVPRQDPDPPRAPRTLLQPATGSRASTSPLSLLFPVLHHPRCLSPTKGRPGFVGILSELAGRVSFFNVSAGLFVLEKDFPGSEFMAPEAGRPWLVSRV